jgi:predicted enzyme related to lactoylglutathione lyase
MGGTQASGSTGVPMRFEAMVLPVSDVDRAKDFYQGLGALTPTSTSKTATE